MTGRYVLAAALLAASWAFPARSATLTVTSTADPGSGQCAPAACTLRDAINSAAPGDTITFADSLGYPVTITLDGDELLLYKDLTLLGPGADKLTIDANRASRIFEVANAATITISGLKLINGLVAGAVGGTDQAGNGTPGGNARGGAILVDSASTLQIVRCVVRNNQAVGGEGGLGVLEPSGDGGSAFGGAVESAGTLMIDASTVADNHATGGSGGFGADTAGGDGGNAAGGAIHASGPVQLTDTQLLRNQAAAGNGAFSDFARGGDGGDARGGAVASDGFVVASSVSMAGNNTVGGAGGIGQPSGSTGVASANDIATTGTLLSRNSVFASDGGAGSCEVVTMSPRGADIAADSTCGSGFTVEEPLLQLIDAAPAPIAYPVWGSPLIDAAADCKDAFGATLTQDARGVVRPLDANADGVAACDIGAVESDELFAGGFD